MGFPGPSPLSLPLPLPANDSGCSIPLPPGGRGGRWAGAPLGGAWHPASPRSTHELSRRGEAACLASSREAHWGNGRVEIGFSTRTSHYGAAVSAAARALNSWRDLQAKRLRYNVAPILSVRYPRLPPPTIFGIPRGRTSRGLTTRNCQKWHARSSRLSRSLRAVWGVRRLTYNVKRLTFNELCVARLQGG